LGRHIGITEREEAVLRALCRIGAKNYPGNTVRLAAMELNIAPQTIYTLLHRLRTRYRKALEFGREYRRWRRKLGDRYL